MTSSRVSPWVYMFLVFAGGIATGFFGDRVATARSVRADNSPRTAEEWKRHYIDDLKRRCNLTTEQTGRVNSILDATHERADAIRSRITPELAALHDQQVKEVRDVMTDSQKVAYDKFRAERDAQRKAAKH